MVTTVIVNGVSIVAGRSIIVSDGKIIVDGKDVTPDAKEINIVVNGNIDKLEVDACSKLAIRGDVGNVHTLSGDVEVTGSVKGAVQTMSGNVECGGPIGGIVSTMSGNVKHR